MFKLGKTTVAILAVFELALSGCQTTGVPINASFTAVSGTPLLIFHYSALNPDCSPRGEIVVRVTGEPAHGQVRTVPASGYSSYVQPNPRNACNDRKTPGIDVIYTAQAGYAGPDVFNVDAIFPGGGESEATDHITVK